MVDYMLDFPLVKFSVMGRIHPQSNRFVTRVENKGTGDSKLNDSSVNNSHLKPSIIVSFLKRRNKIIVKYVPLADLGERPGAPLF